ncbi:MAG: BsaWI family type II restriction enzyme [Methanoregula sp.]|nr:BsaWI family type II restriction enzyme [Methanoregula sp.]
MVTDGSFSSHQSHATIEGNNFEAHVKSILNNDKRLAAHHIRIYNNKDFSEDITLLDRLTINVRNYSEPPNNLNLIAKDTITGALIALICCKLSLHGRISETLFYSMFYKNYLKEEELKVVLVTPDKGRQNNQKAWISEWGTYNNPTKGRILSEYFLDGVYIDNQYLRQRFGIIASTQLGLDLYDFALLPAHLVDWKNGQR